MIKKYKIGLSLLLLSFLFLPSASSATDPGCFWTLSTQCSQAAFWSESANNSRCSQPKPNKGTTEKCCCPVGCCEKIYKGMGTNGNDVVWTFALSKNSCTGPDHRGIYPIQYTFYPNKVPDSKNNSKKCITPSPPVVIPSSAQGCCEEITSHGGVIGGHSQTVRYTSRSFTATKRVCDDKNNNAPHDKQYVFHFGLVPDSTFTKCIKVIFVTNPVTPPKKKNSGPAVLSISGMTNPLKTVIVPKVIGRVIRAIAMIIGTLLLLMFIYGGFLWMTAGGNERNIEKGKNILIWTTLGLIVVFAAYVLVKYAMEAAGIL